MEQDFHQIFQVNKGYKGRGSTPVVMGSSGVKGLRFMTL